MLPSSRRRRIILLVLLLLTLALVSASIVYHETLARLLTRLTMPVVKTTHYLKHSSVLRLATLRSASELQQENEQLRQELARLRTQLTVAEEEQRTLRAQLQLQTLSRSPELEFLPVRTVGYLLQGKRKYVLINRGRDQQVDELLPVIGEQGLVGFVSHIFADFARVQLLIDPQTRVSVVLEKSRIQGVVYGRGEFDTCELLTELPTSGFTHGEKVLTAGLPDSLYPQGLLVGTVVGERPNKLGLPVALIKPAVDFLTLENLLVLHTTP